MSRPLLGDRRGDAGVVRFDEYQGLIDRLRRSVEESIPPGSTVLVLSKGDPALLVLGPRKARHFPRAVNGDYAGFHPVDSSDAIARLDTERGLGARYLVIPATSGWWLDHYKDFARHMRSISRPLVEDPATGWIFELTAREPTPPPVVGDTGGPGAMTRQLIDLLDALLPPSALVAAIVPRDNDLIPNSRLAVFALHYTDDGEGVDAKRPTLAISATMADYLVVPNSSRDWLDQHRDLADYIERSYPLVTDQRSIGKIYDLKPGRGAAN